MSAINVKMFSDKILLEKPEEKKIEEKKTDSGIILPGSVVANSENNRQRWTKVVAIGNKVENVKVGDTVMYDVFSIGTVTIDNIEYIVVRENDLVAARI